MLCAPTRWGGERVAELVEVRWRRCLEAHLGARAWVYEAQSRRVKHRPRRIIVFAPIFHVARYRMSQGREVHSDLMRAAGVEITAQESMPGSPFDHLIARAREAASADHRHPLPFLRIAPDRPLELSRLILHATAHDGQVGAAERAVLKLSRKGSMAYVVARDHDQA